MNKRGFQGRWQNRHWLLTPSAYQRGQTDPNIQSTGSSPNYFSMTSRGRGWYEDDEGDTYDMERVYVSSPLIDELGIYRVGVLYHRTSRSSSMCNAYTFIAECNGDGRIKSYSSSSETALDHTVFAGTCARGWCISEKTGVSWSEAITTIPLITIAGIDLTVGGNAHAIYKQVKDTWTANFMFISLILADATSVSAVTDSALDIGTTTPEPNDICTRMEMFSGDWAYWYGGNGEIATEALLQSKAKQYPDVYNSEIISYARKAINGHTRVADCSYAVSYAYNITRTNAKWFLQNYATWTGTPKNGMFLATAKHVAIYRDGHTMEMHSTKMGYQELPYNPSRFTRVGYDPNRTY